MQTTRFNVAGNGSLKEFLRAIHNDTNELHAGIAVQMRRYEDGKGRILPEYRREWDHLHMLLKTIGLASDLAYTYGPGLSSQYPDLFAPPF